MKPIRLSYANVMASVAVFVALGGTGVAADGVRAVASAVTGKQIKDGTITGKDIRKSSLTSASIKDRSLLGKDFKLGQLPRGVQGPQGVQGERGLPGAKGDTGTVDTSNFYDKGTSDARFARVRSLDYRGAYESSRSFDFFGVNLVFECGLNFLNVKAASTTSIIASGAWLQSFYGGGSTSPSAGRLSLTPEYQNLFGAPEGRMIEGSYLFRSPSGATAHLQFHAGVSAQGLNGCEFHAQVSEASA